MTLGEYRVLASASTGGHLCAEMEAIAARLADRGLIQLGDGADAQMTLTEAGREAYLGAKELIRARWAAECANCGTPL